MPIPYLTKSDFKACRDCRTKLYYRKQGYPSTKDDDEYLQMLARGGFMVELLAKAQFPHGIDLVSLRDPIASHERTAVELGRGDVVLFEAAVTLGKYHVRTDILRREGDVLHLVEIKSSSVGEKDMRDGRPFLTGKGTVKSDWAEYIEDVAFQAMVLRHAYPQWRVIPYLCLVDKRQVAAEPETLAHFALRPDPANPRSRPSVEYAGDAQNLRGSRLLITIDVSQEVGIVAHDVERRAIELAGLIDGPVTRRATEDVATHYNQCRTCEYRVPEGRSGFAECWGALAHVPAHILDLHRVGQIGTTKVPDPVPDIIRSGRASYLDLSDSALGNGNAWHQRRIMQRSSVAAGGRECLPAALRRALESHEQSPGWPLHFVDFEACNVCLPHHAELRPYERVAFQFSCHSLASDGALHHREYLNTERRFPNFVFLRHLREALGDHGTIYVWSPYEQSTLRNISDQLVAWRRRDEGEVLNLAGLTRSAELDELHAWLEQLIGANANGDPAWPRIRDLLRLAEEHYFHPMMKGRTSIKVTLPGAWESNAALRAHRWFAEYDSRDDAGRVIDPYATLQALPLGEPDEEDAVREGTGAVRVYQDMIFRSNQDPEECANRERLLKQYCRLDTAAMLFIHQHWRNA